MNIDHKWSLIITVHTWWSLIMAWKTVDHAWNLLIMLWKAVDHTWSTLIIAMKDCWSFMINIDRCIISRPLTRRYRSDVLWGSRVLVHFRWSVGFTCLYCIFFLFWALHFSYFFEKKQLIFWKAQTHRSGWVGPLSPKKTLFDRSFIWPIEIYIYN